MSVISGSFNNIIPTQQKKSGSHSPINEREMMSRKEIAESPKAQSNRMIIEMHLKIQVQARQGIGIQTGIKKQSNSVDGFDLSQLEYKGKPITDLSQEEAQALVREDGYFGVRQTAERISSFAINGAGDDLEKLKLGRDAVLKGFKEAEDLFNGSLPGISHETIEKTLETIDEKIRALGGSVMDVEA